MACEWAGIETVAFCEREPFCQKVLKKHWANVPIYDDVCTLTKERLEADGIGTIDLIHGGDPCQPYSIAGKREGKDDDRFLWKEVVRLLQELQPRWYVRENVTGNISLEFDDMLSDMDNIGYTTETVIIPASAIGAIHRRDRLFTIAYANSKYGKRDFPKEIQGEQALQSFPHYGSPQNYSERSHQYQPKLFGDHNGISGKLDRRRLKALGNAVNPYQIYPILAAIKQINDMLKE